MSVQSLDGEHATGLTDLLSIGFGTTVAMWAVGYVGHMPLADAPPLVFVSLMLVCLAAGGWIVGKKTPRGLPGGLGLGLIVALLNLLILGSVRSMLAEPNSGQMVPQAWLWLSGYFVICLALATGGAAAGTVLRSKSDRSVRAGATARRDAPPRPLAGEESGVREPDWLLVFAWTACLATLLLISVGGLVTGFRAGMAVPDWPNTYGSNMFLYPLAKMTGGVFYEHAHRLLGSLVGLTTLVLAILLSFDGRSIPALILVWTVGLCVGLQGVMGGFRVTDATPAIRDTLAVAHGFFAHVILAGMVGVAMLLRYSSRSAVKDITAERDEYSSNARSPGETDAFLATLLVLAILGQTLLGTLVRQMDIGLIVHLSVAMLVAVLAILVGVRLWGLYPHIAVVARGGVALLGVVALQIILGGISLACRTPPAAASPSAEQLQTQAEILQPAAHALLTTAHQTTAAVLLGIAALLAFSAWRFAVMQGSLTPTETPRARTETATL